MSYLIWCLWRERNNRNFENRERTIVELKSLFFNTLYHWTTALVYLNLPNFHHIYLFLSYFSFWLGVSLVFLCLSCTFALF
jgi:hypothetical protein